VDNLSEEPSPISVDADVVRRPIGAGSLVGGRYQLTRLLGHGSMGEVWAAHHQGLGETAALKLLTQAPSAFRLESQSASAARFRFEAKLAARLSRKTRHIVRVNDYGEEEGIPYLVMELLEGETLEARLFRGPLLAAPVATIVAQIARALEEAHADGVVHRDLKPANVFLTCDEEGALLVKLLDFGIARMIRADGNTPPVTAHGLWCGTPGYLSPEQARMEKLDTRCDLWALATVAYEALTGELPVAGATAEELIANLHARCFVPIHERAPQLASSLAPFFERAFAERIECRFSTASEVAAAFESAVDGEPFVEASVEESTTAEAATAAALRSPERPREPSRWTSFAGTVFRRARDTRVVMAMIGAIAGLLTFAVAKAAWGPAGPPTNAAMPAAPLPVTLAPSSAAFDFRSRAERDSDIEVHPAPSAPRAEVSRSAPMAAPRNAARESRSTATRELAPHKTQVASIPSAGPRVLLGPPPSWRPPEGTSASATAKSAKSPVDRSSLF